MLMLVIPFALSFALSGDGYRGLYLLRLGPHWR